ncbi:hypothetical protein GLOIN_2v1835304 [Rhizophagus clarus]|uniref:Uncharacterized protein n=1 Tax=Rhizophagus clarus TaxID=94130 RepID=A0A8H3LXZ4_9GLOM|nr:hypothetical protein GLOIN_2v1835304 [Rhizophagus clarus]
MKSDWPKALRTSSSESSLSFESSSSESSLSESSSSSGSNSSESSLSSEINSSESSSSDSDIDEISILELTEDVLDDDTDLRKNVKRVLEVIVDLLKDRALCSEEPTTKKHRVEEIINKKESYHVVKLEVLKQRIIELEAENAEIPELRKKLAEIPELRKKLAEVEARNIEIKARNEELMKQMIEENN